MSNESNTFPTLMSIIREMTLKDYLIMGVLIILLIITLISICVFICRIKKKIITDHNEEHFIVGGSPSHNECHYQILVIDD